MLDAGALRLTLLFVRAVEVGVHIVCEDSGAQGAAAALAGPVRHSKADTADPEVTAAGAAVRGQVKGLERTEAPLFPVVELHGEGNAPVRTDRAEAQLQLDDAPRGRDEELAEGGFENKGTQSLYCLYDPQEE